MALQRYSLVFVGFLIIALVLAAPVSAARTHSAGPFNLTMAPAPASSGTSAVDASTRAMFDAAVTGDMSVLTPPPALTAFDSISPGDSLQAAIDAAPDGSTIYLDPGTYYEHDLIINKNIMIRANETLGGNRANTIIDARGEGRIFTVGNNYDLSLDNLTLQNGRVSGDGGAISITGGTLSIFSTSITNCSATGHGGAIYSFAGMTVVGYSTISRCTSTGFETSGAGGAIYSDQGILITGYSTYSDCSAPDSWGGAIEADSFLGIISSTFTRCSAVDGGALDFYDPGAIVIDSTFTDCTATGNGGAIWYLDGGSLSILSSRFTGCSAGENGGAIAANGGTSLEAVTFTGCMANTYGGAIFIGGGSTVDVGLSSFTRCSAASGGGAIATLPVALHVTSSSFERCSAGLDGGGAILSFSTTDVHFSRFYQNTATGSGTAIRFVSGTVDASNNWWGTNSDPSPFVYGPVTTSPWLLLNISGDRRILLSRTASIRTNLTNNTAGTDTTSGGIFVPDGITNTFAVPSHTGSVSPVTDGTRTGTAGTTFTPEKAGTGTISSTVDGQTVYLDVDVEPLFYPTLDTRSGDSDPRPAVNPNAGIPSATVPLMTVTVNIGGDSKAWQAMVTGTALRDLIVTGIVQNGPGPNMTAPPGRIYQYISLIPARYTTITNAAINFTVPQSWLDENHIAPGSIVLYHQAANGWEALPTTVLYTKDGTGYFSAESAGFSLFAITGTPSVLTPPGIAATQAIVSIPVQEQPPAPAAVAEAPLTTQTTAPAATPQPAAPSPLLNIVLIIAAIGVLAGGGFIARRWWIRKENPALFEEYD